MYSIWSDKKYKHANKTKEYKTLQKNSETLLLKEQISQSMSLWIFYVYPQVYTPRFHTAFDPPPPLF
jgi:hypothetical protein